MADPQTPDTAPERITIGSGSIELNRGPYAGENLAALEIGATVDLDGAHAGNWRIAEFHNSRFLVTLERVAPPTPAGAPDTDVPDEWIEVAYAEAGWFFGTNADGRDVLEQAIRVVRPLIEAAQASRVRARLHDTVSTTISQWRHDDPLAALAEIDGVVRKVGALLGTPQEHPEPLRARWDGGLSHDDTGTAVQCVAEDGRPVALVLDVEHREALGAGLCDPDGEDDQGEPDGDDVDRSTCQHPALTHAGHCVICDGVIVIPAAEKPVRSNAPELADGDEALARVLAAVTAGVSDWNALESTAADGFRTLARKVIARLGVLPTADRAAEFVRAWYEQVQSGSWEKTSQQAREKDIADVRAALDKLSAVDVTHRVVADDIGQDTGKRWTYCEDEDGPCTAPRPRLFDPECVDRVRTIRRELTASPEATTALDELVNELDAARANAAPGTSPAVTLSLLRTLTDNLEQATDMARVLRDDADPKQHDGGAE